MTLFSPAYFAPIEYYNKLLNCKTPVLEICENFQKQSYRTRCHIYGANGKLALNVPVLHKGERRLTSATKISYSENWQANHLKSIQIAYRTSAYFEFFEDFFVNFFNTKYENVLDLDTASFELIKKCLGLDVNFKHTQSYQKTPEDTDIIDFRDSFSPKKQNSCFCSPYIQVFEDKYGFIPNLSVLDLIFNLGKSSVDYLKTSI